MIRAPVNRSNAASTSTGGGPNALNVSNHGFGMNNSGHSCCSSSTRGGNDTYGNVSLSNIFADEEERIDIFGENSMIGFITTLQVEQNLKNEQEGHHTCPHHSGSFERKSPQKKNNSMRSIKTLGTDSTSTWQGSCNSFLGILGMSDELLNLSFTVNDFDKGNDDLSLHAKNTASSCTSATKKIPRNLSRKDILLSNLKEKATANSKVNIHGTTRSTQPKVTNSLVVTGGGMHHCFGEDHRKSSVDVSPRKPVRRGEEDETLPESEAVTRAEKLRDALDLLSNIIDIPNVDEESSSSEVIKINLTSASRNEQGDESDRWDCRITDTISTVPLSCSSHSEGEFSSKEDSAPKCPRRGKSPSRSVSEKPKEVISENLGNNPSTNLATETEPTECMTSPSPKKKVMKIAIKDLEKYVSDVPETNGRIQKSAISSLRYQKILKAAKETELSRRTENERVKISMNVVANRDVGTSPFSSKCSVPLSIAVDSSDCSLSSMDDSSRSFIRETRYVTPTRRKNNLSPSKSSRFATKSPSSCKQIVATNVKSNPNTSTQKAATQISSTITSSTKGLPQMLRRVKSCNIVDEVQVNIVDGSRNQNFNGPKSSSSSSSSSSLKKRYDSPIVRPAEYIFPPATPTTPPNATVTQVTAFSSPQRRKIVDTTDGGDCNHYNHHHRDKPPTSPRRYITPTRESRSK